MPKRRNHFVPKFYLNLFASAERRIHLYNLARSKAFQNASIRNQCYRRNFYGKDDDIENYFSKIEDATAPHLQEIIAKGVLPRTYSDGHYALLAFVASQIARTPLWANNHVQLLDKMVEQIFSGQRVPHDFNPEGAGVGPDFPIAVGLESFVFRLICYLDLKAHLVVSPNEEFLTSDNPVFRYNQYCECVQYQGVLGDLSKGLQIFLPLSPRFLLILYDGKVYEPRLLSKLRRISKANLADMASLNHMQLLGAEKNIYFSSWDQIEMIRRLLPETNALRDRDTSVVQEFGQDNDPDSSLVHAFQRLTNISLHLSFLRIRKKAQQVPLGERANGVRCQPTNSSSPNGNGKTITFSRFIGRR